MQLLSQLQSTFSTELTITQLFSALTPIEQAQLIDQQHSENGLKADSLTVGSSISDGAKANGSSADTIPRRQKNALTDINDLSDETIDDLLGQLLAEEQQEAIS